MDIEKIRELRYARPFRPFILRLNDGREFIVHQPYYVGFSPKSDLLLVSSDTGTAWFPPSHVADLRYVPNMKVG